ncbi:MAG: YwiC-like family protein [Polyangiales bacterium]
MQRTNTTTAATQTARSRSLLPKEHGAWPQLLLPLATALLARPSLASGLVACAAVAAFFAHEPVLVLRGLRGKGALDRERPRALRWLICATAAAVSAAFGALATTHSSGARLVLAAAPSLTLAIALAGFVYAESERTDAGECVAATALSSVVVPMGVASGATMSAALTQWLVWSVGFIALTGAVRTVLAGPKKRDPRPSRRIAVMATVAAIAMAPLTAGATVISALCATALLLWPPAVKNIRRAGWGLAFGSLATGACLLAQ